MKIITCYKLVCDEQDIAIAGDRSLDVSKAEPKVNQFDLNAIEAGMQIAADVQDSTVTALCVGGQKYLDNSKVRKDVLSRGPDSLVLVIDESLQNALPHVSAQALAAASQKIGFDLIICGDGSGDLYAQQVGLLLGELLQVPTINAISKVVSVDSHQIVVERTLEDEVEVLAIPLPAVISVTADINVPKIPAMKAILSAAKKPANTYSAADIGFVTTSEVLAEMIAVKAPEQKQRSRIVIEGDGEEQIAEFVQQLKKAFN